MHRPGVFRTNQRRAEALGLRPAPQLKGFYFRTGKVEQAIRINASGASPRYLGIFIETIGRCNLDCWFCYSKDAKGPGRVIGLQQMRDAVDAMAGFGAESVIVAGKGEPLVDDALLPLARHVSKKGMRLVLFTNNTLISPQIASELHDLNTTVIAKIGSLIPERQDGIVGVPGAYRRIRRGFDNLLEAGFRQPRLAVDFTVTMDSMDEALPLWRYLRSQSIIPFYEPLISSGGALSDPERLSRALVPRDELTRLFLRLRELDEREFGFTWAMPRGMRIPGFERCRRHETMLTLRQDGDVGTCVNGLDTVAGNIFKESLQRIIEDSPLLKKIREGRNSCSSRFCGNRKG
jgi:MoaA/NifB/PqqE/SkfB family radical SAM enzyme